MISRYIKEFGIKLFAVNGITRLLSKLHIPVKGYGFKKHRIDEAYLLKKYRNCLTSDFNFLTVDFSAPKRIYVFWWDGEETAPETVKVCIESIKRCNSLETVVLTKDNYAEYVQLPDYIVEKVKSGTMGLAHFSDVLRFALLYKYGGIWMDATCFQLKETPNEILEKEFYSLNGVFDSSDSIDWKWTSFYMAGKPGNIVCKGMLSFYFDYWREHSEALTYLILDCWMTVLYENNSEINAIIDSVEKSDNSIFLLNEIANNPMDASAAEAIKTKTFFQKVTYKVDYYPEKDGQLTNWGYITNHELRETK